MSHTTIEATPPASVSITPPPAPHVVVEAPAAAQVSVEARTAVTSVEAQPQPVVEIAASGLPGPRGPAGSGGGAAYTHTQSVTSALWTINHDLGFRPAVTLLTTGGVEFAGQITHTSANQALVYLNTPMAGTARLT